MDFFKKITEIILIDDDIINNFYHQMLIKQQIGFSGKISVFTDAEEALKTIHTNNNSNHQLFLVDINMPLMNGFEFIETYQKLSPKNNAIFCMLTSSLHERDKELAKQFPCIKSFFTKPLQKDDLNNFINTEL